MKNLKISSLLDVYGEFLSEKQRVVTEHYYNDDLSLSELAENEGITRQAVCDLIKRAEAQLLSLEEKCGYCKKFLKLKELSTAYTKGETKSLNEILEIINNL